MVALLEHVGPLVELLVALEEATLERRSSLRRARASSSASRWRRSFSSFASRISSFWRARASASIRRASAWAAFIDCGCPEPRASMPTTAPPMAAITATANENQWFHLLVLPSGRTRPEDVRRNGSGGNAGDGYAVPSGRRTAGSRPSRVLRCGAARAAQLLSTGSLRPPAPGVKRCGGEPTMKKRRRSRDAASLARRISGRGLPLPCDPLACARASRAALAASRASPLPAGLLGSRVGVASLVVLVGRLADGAAVVAVLAADGVRPRDLGDDLAVSVRGGLTRPVLHLRSVLSSARPRRRAASHWLPLFLGGLRGLPRSRPSASSGVSSAFSSGRLIGAVIRGPRRRSPARWRLARSVATLLT